MRPEQSKATKNLLINMQIRIFSSRFKSTMHIDSNVITPDPIPA